MTTMNISLPDSLKDFVDQRVTSSGYGTSSEYVRDLIRRDKDRLQLRTLLLEGAASPVTGAADADYFDSLRKTIRKRQSHSDV
jgi:antitoxin ParD1/3/4